MSTQRSTLVAVFNDRAMAEQAIEKLQDAGFQNDQLHYSGGHTGAGVLSAIKNLFMGEDYPTSNNLVGDLESIGIPGEEAEYYVRENQSGHPIVAIDAGEHVREAEEILNSNGAYRYGMNSGAASVAAKQSREMPSNEEIQGIGDYTSQAGYGQPVTPPSNTVDSSDQPYNVSSHGKGLPSADSLTESGQTLDDSDYANEDEGYYYNRSSEGENTSGYARTDNVLRGVDSAQPPMSPLSDSAPQNKVNRPAFDAQASSGSGQAPAYGQARTQGDAASYYPPSGLEQQPTDASVQEQEPRRERPGWKRSDTSSEEA